MRQILDYGSALIGLGWMALSVGICGVASDSVCLYGIPPNEYN